MTKQPAKKKHAGGRATSYKAEYAEQAQKLCLLGATDREMADFFGCAESTINLWKKRHKEFSESIKRGKAVADGNVADRLYQRAMGFEHDSEEIKVVSDGRIGSHIERVPVRKIYPPETTAAIFWLKNRQATKWRDKQEIDATISSEVKLSDEQAEQLLRARAKRSDV